MCASPGREDSIGSNPSGKYKIGSRSGLSGVLSGPKY